MGVRFVTHPAPEALAGAVRELWLFEDDGDLHAGLPKPNVELVISLSGIHFWRASLSGLDHRFDCAWLTPLQEASRYAWSSGRRRLIGARLEPWAAHSLFGILPRGDGSPPPLLRNLIGDEADRLRDRLTLAPTEEACFLAFSAWLSGQPALQMHRPLWRQHKQRVSDLAEGLGISERSLRRRFSEDIGIAPKRWLRLKRLDGVLRDLASPNGGMSLTDLADAHGFADQAHLNRELTRMTGATPNRLKRRESGTPPHLLINPGRFVQE